MLTIRELARAANQAERRIRENSPVIVAALNKLMDSDLLTIEQKAEIKHAWQWGVYGAAVHLQIALGDKLRDELNAEQDADIERFWYPAPPPTK